MSARENIAINITQQLENMAGPAIGSVSRKFFDVEKLAIPQFPAIQIITGNEDRIDISTTEREGVIEFVLRCYVRGGEIDTLRNELVERIEETLEVSRDRDITYTKENVHHVSTQVTNVEVVERQPPLGEVVVTVTVTYRYTKGVV